MSLDRDQTDLCKECHTYNRMVTDRSSADVVCTECGHIWGKWNPEHPGDDPPERTIYERNNYFEAVLDNTLGYDTNRFSMNDLAEIRRANPEVKQHEWNVGIVRASTRRLKMSSLTKSAGRMAHALKFGVRCTYPRLHHIERECMSGMFSYAAKVFEENKGGKNRKNLISYAFVIGKLLEEMGRGEEFKHLIVPIKTRSKRAYAEKMWKLVERRAPWKSSLRHRSNRVGWEYLESTQAAVLPIQTRGAVDTCP